MSAMHPYSPAGNFIQVMDGDPASLETTGSDMFMLGWDMFYSALTLKSLAESSDGQYGESITALREEVGDAHVLLEKAGDMYRGVGSAIRDYAQEVAEIKPKADSWAEDAFELWQEYNSLPGDKDGRSYGLIMNRAPEEGSAEAKEHEAEDKAKQAAYEAWEEVAIAFDAEYGAWLEIWNTTRGLLNDELNDDLKDGFWEGLQEFKDVLSWVALAIAVVAIFVGGPIIGLIALAVGVVVAAISVIQWLNGKCSLTTMLLDVVGILPIGKLSKVGRLFMKGQRSTFFTKSSTWSAVSDFKNGAQKFSKNDAFKIFTGSSAKDLDRMLLLPKGKRAKLPDGSIFHGMDPSNANFRVIMGRIEAGAAFGNHWLGMYENADKIAEAFGGDLPNSPRKDYPWLKFLK